MRSTGDGWIGHEYTPDTFKAPYAKLSELVEEQGRSIDEIEITIAATAHTAQDLHSPDAVAEWEDVGVNRMVRFFGAVDNSSNAAEVMEAFATVHL